MPGNKGGSVFGMDTHFFSDVHIGFVGGFADEQRSEYEEFLVFSLAPLLP